MMIGASVPVFYDCEASSIGGLPIEIGWAFADIATGKIVSESHLIKSPANWDIEPVWDPDAEKLHRISRDQLIAQGKPPIEIVNRMNTVLAGRKLYSNSPVDDERWLFKMWEDAGVPAFTVGERQTIALPAPKFAIRKMHAGKLIGRIATKLGWDASDFKSAKAEAAHLAPRKHRAEADARHLAQLWLIIARGPHARG